MSANIILLDRLLAYYGSDTKDVRDLPLGGLSVDRNGSSDIGKARFILDNRFYREYSGRVGQGPREGRTSDPAEDGLLDAAPSDELLAGAGAARAHDLLQVFSNLFDFVADWSDTHPVDRYAKLDTPEDFGLDSLDDDENMYLLNVVGMGTPTAFCSDRCMRRRLAAALLLT